MRFSIRDLFLVTVIVALAVGWCIDHRRQASKEHSLVIERDEARVAFRMLLQILTDEGYEVEREREFLVHSVNPPNSSAPAPNPPKP